MLAENGFPDLPAEMAKRRKSTSIPPDKRLCDAVNEVLGWDLYAHITGADEEGVDFVDRLELKIQHYLEHY